MEIGDTVNNINSSSSYVDYGKERTELLLKEYRELKQEYTSTPYHIGKETFKPILVYENDKTFSISLQKSVLTLYY